MVHNPGGKANRDRRAYRHAPAAPIAERWRIDPELGRWTLGWPAWRKSHRITSKFSFHSRTGFAESGLPYWKHPRILTGGGSKRWTATSPRRHKPVPDASLPRPCERGFLCGEEMMTSAKERRAHWNHICANAQGRGVKVGERTAFWNGSRSGLPAGWK